MTDMKRVLRQCRRAGLQLVLGRKHHKLVDPATGRWVSVSSTASCRNAHKNVAADVRKFLGVSIA